METIKFENLTDIDLKHIFECGQCFRWNDEAGDGSYIGVVGENLCRAKLANGTLTLEVSGGDKIYWQNYFDLDRDYGEIKETLIKSDERMIEAIDAGYGIRILRQDFWETLISFIVSQNNNIPRIKKCIEAVCETYGDFIGEYFGKARYAFPSPEVLAVAAEEGLTALKLGYRASYIVKAAKRYIKYGKPAGSRENQFQELLEYTGVGPKVANCIMLFALNDYESFPIDTWIKKIMHELFELDENNIREMTLFAKERFGSYGGFAQQYLFYCYRK